MSEKTVEEITIDLHSGEFYKEVDDETLEIALTAMWEDFDHWSRHRGVILGEA